MLPEYEQYFALDNHKRPRKGAWAPCESRFLVPSVMAPDVESGGRMRPAVAFNDFGQRSPFVMPPEGAPVLSSICLTVYNQAWRRDQSRMLQP